MGHLYGQVTYGVSFAYDSWGRGVHLPSELDEDVKDAIDKAKDEWFIQCLYAGNIEPQPYFGVEISTIHSGEVDDFDTKKFKVKKKHEAEYEKLRKELVDKFPLLEPLVANPTRFITWGG